MRAVAIILVVSLSWISNGNAAEGPIILRCQGTAENVALDPLNGTRPLDPSEIEINLDLRAKTLGMVSKQLGSTRDFVITMNAPLLLTFKSLGKSAGGATGSADRETGHVFLSVSTAAGVAKYSLTCTPVRTLF